MKYEVNSSTIVNAIKLLLLLVQDEIVKADEAGKELGLTDRQIRTIVKAIRTAGVPVKSKTGPTGGYMLDRDSDPRLRELLAIAKYINDTE